MTLSTPFVALVEHIKDDGLPRN